jgi:predicted glycogen debranching enzyme
MLFRSTFLVLRGLCIAVGRMRDARAILLGWTDPLSDGMLPNRFPDGGGEPEFNSVDGSLWFAIAVQEWLDAAGGSRLLTGTARMRLQDAVVAILEGYARGTRYGIRLDEDGLLASGERGQQLTWMDARVNGQEITPRTGKPVEVQALWLNALHAAAGWDARWKTPLATGLDQFTRRFWNPQRACLYDVVDVDHRAGVNDAAVRPNQVFAVGGLPLPILRGERARAVVDVVERELWTPMGLRSLSPHDAGYAGRYDGGPAARDGAYHQGTVWPWLIAAFVDAWIRARENTPGVPADAFDRFVAPLEAHLGQAGLGHVSEIADGDAPYVPRGCPFQAWSLGELIRARQMCGAGGRTAPAGGPAATASASR